MQSYGLQVQLIAVGAPPDRIQQCLSVHGLPALQFGEDAIAILVEPNPAAPAKGAPAQASPAKAPMAVRSRLLLQRRRARGFRRAGAGSRPGVLSLCSGQHLRRGGRHYGPPGAGDAGYRRVQAGAERRPPSSELSNALADLYFRSGHTHEAASTARALLKSTPDDIDAHKLLGRIYLRELSEGKDASPSTSSSSDALDQAIAEFERVVALDPTSVEDRMVLGQLYTVKHDEKKAEEQFKTAQDLEPDSEEVVLNLARLYAESGDIAREAKVIEAVPVDDRTPKLGMRWARPTSS